LENSSKVQKTLKQKYVRRGALGFGCDGGPVNGSATRVDSSGKPPMEACGNVFKETFFGGGGGIFIARNLEVLPDFFTLCTDESLVA
jgi:hypothetical protein